MSQKDWGWDKQYIEPFCKSPRFGANMRHVSLTLIRDIYDSSLDAKGWAIRIARFGAFVVEIIQIGLQSLLGMSLDRRLLLPYQQTSRKFGWDEQ